MHMDNILRDNDGIHVVIRVLSESLKKSTQHSKSQLLGPTEEGCTQDEKQTISAIFECAHTNIRTLLKSYVWRNLCANESKHFKVFILSFIDERLSFVLDICTSR